MQSTEDRNELLLVSAQLNVLKVAVDRLDTFLKSTKAREVKHLKSAVEEVERKLTQRFPEVADYEIQKGPEKLYIYEGLPVSWTNWFTLDEFLETITDPEGFEHIKESTETFKGKFEKTAGLIKEHTSYSGPTDIKKVVWAKVALLIATQATRKNYLIALKESKEADRWFIASPVPLTMDGVELRFRPEDVD